MAATGVAALGFAGCTDDAPGASSGPVAPSSTTTTEAADADPDLVALDRAVELSRTLLAEAVGAEPGADPGRRLAALHTVHLTALDMASSSSSSSPSPELAAPARTPTRKQIRRRELAAQRELAHLAIEVESGALARLVASMSAGIAAHLVDRSAP